MTVDMIHMKGQAMTDHTTVVEEEVATDRMIDLIVRGGTTEEVGVDMRHVEIEEVTIEDEEGTIEVIPEAMIEVEEEGTIEVAIEVIQEGIREEVMAAIPGAMHHEETEAIQEAMIVGIAEAAMNPEVGGIEVEGDMTEVLESIRLAEEVVNIGLESILVQGVTQVTE